MAMETVEVLAGLLTTKQLARLFERSELTIMHWRQTEGLPQVRLPGDGRDSVRYRLERVKDWARDKNRYVNRSVLAELEADSPRGEEGGSDERRRFDDEPYVFVPRPAGGGSGEGCGLGERVAILV